MHEEGGMQEMKGSKKWGMHHRAWHWACCILPVLTVIFWLASIVFVIAAWVSVVRRSLVWGFPPDWWLVNALMFGVLSLFGRGRKGSGCCGGCGGCCGSHCAPGMYKVDK